MRRVVDRARGALLALTLALALIAAPALAAPASWVMDEAGVLPAEAAARIEALSARVAETTSGAQVAVVTVRSLDGRTIEEFAEQRFETLGIGDAKADNGVLLLVAPTERKVRIEVGYGMEGALPDARAGRIIDEVILPAFRSGDLPGGIEKGHAAIVAVMEQEYGFDLGAGARAGEPVATGDDLPPEWVFTVIVCGVIILVLILIAVFSKSRRGGGDGGSGPWLFGGGGGDSGGDFGGFGGGDSGGGGASGDW